MQTAVSKVSNTELSHDAFPRGRSQKRQVKDGGWLQQEKTESHAPERWRAGGLEEKRCLQLQLKFTEERGRQSGDGKIGKTL